MRQLLLIAEVGYVINCFPDSSNPQDRPQLLRVGMRPGVKRVQHALLERQNSAHLCVAHGKRATRGTPNLWGASAEEGGCTPTLQGPRQEHSRTRKPPLSGLGLFVLRTARSSRAPHLPFNPAAARSVSKLACATRSSPSHCASAAVATAPLDDDDDDDHASNGGSVRAGWAWA